MTITKTNICNQAMIAVGGLLITDVDTDTSKRATTMKELYDIKRNWLLRKFTWTFATKRATLTVVDNKLDFDAETTDFVVDEIVMSPPETEIELLIDGDFSAPDPNDAWTLGNNATLASVAGGKSGNCLQITCDGAANPSAYQESVVVAGASYKFQGYVKAGTEATYRVIIHDVTNEKTIWTSGELEETAGDWSTKIEKEFVVPSECVLVRTYLYQQAALGAGTTFLFDSVTLFREVQGTIKSIMRNGTTGILWLSNVDGTFVDDETLIGNIAGSATINGILQSVTPVNEFDYIYALPSDYSKLIELYPKYLKYRLESNFILSGESSTLDIRYTYKVTDENQFDAAFIEAFAALLAKEAGIKLIDSIRKKKELRDEYDDKIAEAKYVGSIEDDLEDVWAEDWLTERL